jgi:hypothetical protein
MIKMLRSNPYFEQPQIKNGMKNPNQFTIDQHVFPRAGIARFCGLDSRVQAFMLDDCKVRMLSPTNERFCAQRVWDQGTETLTARTTEAAFDDLAGRIVRGEMETVDARASEIVTQFRALWCARFDARWSPPRSTAMTGILPGTQLTKDDAENLEANGYSYALGVTMPSRVLAGLRVRIQTMQMAHRWPGATWGILRSDGAEFLVPDNAINVAMIPVSPTICLVLAGDDRNINPMEVAQINRLFAEFSYRYYFARDLDRCPIHRRTIPRIVSSMLTACGPVP